MKLTFIAWTKYHRRSELLAQHLSATLHFFHFGQHGKPYQAPLKYPNLSVQTWRTLRRERPDIILTQNPPIFCALLVYIYCLVYGAQFIIDSHTGAFLSGWRWSVGLHHFLSRRAIMTIVHNKSQAQIVAQWNCPYCVIGYTPGEYPLGDTYPFSGTNNIVVVSTFAEDEPVEVILRAAARVPEIHFYFSGDSSRLSLRDSLQIPANCVLTGYLSYEQYIGLLRGADAVLDLTCRDHTLLMGGFEAVALGKPLITSDWPILKEYFSGGTIHVSNTIEGLLAGVQRLEHQLPILQADMEIFRDELQVEWEQNLQTLQSEIHKSWTKAHAKS